MSPGDPVARADARAGRCNLYTYACISTWVFLFKSGKGWKGSQKLPEHEGPGLAEFGLREISF